ncbi:ABC transporter ATP-binding protein [Nocardiopsis coralliicola]
MLWSFLHPHRRTLGISLLLALAGSAAELATPMVAKLLMDGFTDPGGPSLTPLWLLIGLMAAGGAVGLVYAVLIGTAAERIVLDARTALVNRFFGASPLRLLRRPAGELVTRVTSDTVLLREAASSSVVSLVNGGVLLAGTLFMMGLLDLVLLGVAAASITVVTALFLTLMPAIARAQQKAQDSLGRMGGVLDGALRALRTVKAGGAERQLSERILADARESARHGIRSVRVEAVGWTIAGTGIQLAIIAILGVGALRVADGAIEVSTLVAFLLYSFNLLFPVMEIAQSVTTLQSGIAAARRIREVEDIPLEPEGPGGGAPGAPDSPAAPAALPEAASGLHVRRLSASGSTGPAAGAPPVLSLRGVTARYAPGAPEVLRGVDLDIPRRGHTALVGPSGAGKTSLFSVFLRFLEPEQGTVALDGRRYAELAPAEVRRRFAYVEQDTPVLPGSVRDNLLLTRPDAGDAEIRAVLDEVHLLDTVDALDGGIDAPLSGDAVSGGQRQRLAVARALLADPDVLLLDEATAQVDAVTEAAITAALRSRAERGAVVTIAHRLSTVIGADRIAVLDGGRVRAEGTHGALLATDGLYRRFVQALHIAGPEAAADPDPAGAR